MGYQLLANVIVRLSDDATEQTVEHVDNVFRENMEDWNGLHTEDVLSQKGCEVELDHRVSSGFNMHSLIDEIHCSDPAVTAVIGIETESRAGRYAYYKSEKTTEEAFCAESLRFAERLIENIRETTDWARRPGPEEGTKE